MKKGFTLVEIMIVVAIIAILAAIAIPNFIAYRRTAQMNACIANLKQLDTASEAWLIKTGGTEITTVTMAALVGDTAGMGFIKETLTCPAKGTYTAPTATTGDASHWTCSYATDTEYPHKVPTSTKAEEKKEGGEG